jgi:rubredoxin
MATPCPRCGTSKTESVPHGLIYQTFWRMGYHLRRCSFCNRRRIFKRGDTSRVHPDDMTAEELRARFNRELAAAGGRRPSPPLPAEEVEVESQSEGEIYEPEAHGSHAVVDEAPTDEEYPDYHLCPECGSTIYRRSHRRWWEKLIGRPRMARCMKCRHRFPYPR